MSAIGMSWTSTSLFLMRWSNRSSGPSKFSSLTGNASAADSKSECCWSVIVSVFQLHRVTNTFHRFNRHGARLLGTLEHHVFQIPGPGDRGRAPLTNRLEIRVDRLR